MNIICNGNGIGDAVCSLYVLPQGSNFYTRHPDWFRDVQGVNVLPPQALKSPPDGNTYTEDAQNFRKYGKKYTRKEIYGMNIGVGAVKKPRMAKLWKPGTNIVLLSPFSAWANREWPVNKWIELSESLSKAGWRVIAIGAPGEAARFKDFTCECHTDLGPTEVLDLMVSCTALLGNDSGMAHVAGMYDVPTLAVMDETLGFRHIFSHTSVRSVKSGVESLSGISVVDAQKAFTNLITERAPGLINKV